MKKITLLVLLTLISSNSFAGKCNPNVAKAQLQAGANARTADIKAEQSAVDAALASVQAGTRVGQNGAIVNNDVKTMQSCLTNALPGVTGLFNFDLASILKNAKNQLMNAGCATARNATAQATSQMSNSVNINPSFNIPGVGPIGTGPIGGGVNVTPNGGKNTTIINGQVNP